MRALHAEFRFERTDELAEEVDDVARDVLVEAAHHVGVDEGRENDRANAAFFFNGIDAMGGLKRLLDRVDERDAGLLIGEIRELGENRMRERFGGNGGAVAYDEYRSGGRSRFGHG